MTRRAACAFARSLAFAPALAFAGALALPLLLIPSCSYGPATATHRISNAMPEPGGHRFAVVLLSTESREPAGILARLSGGGRTKLLGERMTLWLCDADRGTAARLATLSRPAPIQSGFAARIVGWDPPGGESAGVYVEVSGRQGAASDAPFLRWLLRFGVEPDPGMNMAVPFLPNEAVRPRAPGPLRGGREIQVSLRGDSVDLRADTRPEFTPMFRVDERTGDVALVPGAAPLGAGLEPRAASRAHTGVAGGDLGPGGLPALRPHPLTPTGPRAAPAIWCDSVQLFLRQFAPSPIRRGSEPFEDPLSVRPFPACSVELDGPWDAVSPRRTPWGALSAWLQARGFVRDPRYDANDPDGTSALFRRGDWFCAYAATWPASGGRAGNGIGGPDPGPPTRYHLAVWSGVSR